MELYIAFAALILLLFAVAFTAFYQVFARKGQTDLSDRAQLMGSSLFPYEADIAAGVKWIGSQKWRELEITSRDGLRLRGRWLPCSGAKRAVLLFHGYRSMPHNDFGLTARWFYERGWSVFLAEQRAHSGSEGRWICLGAKERFDCRLWMDRILEVAGAETKLVLGGVSMGGATVLLSAGLDPPENVRAIFADCAFTSPKEILRYFIKKRFFMPVFPLLQLLGLCCRLFCGFGLSEASAVEAMRKNAKIPVLFMHGEADITVPVSMAEENYAACAAPKRLVKSELAGHAAFSLADRERYFLELGDFLEEYVR